MDIEPERCCKLVLIVLIMGSAALNPGVAEAQTGQKNAARATLNRSTFSHHQCPAPSWWYEPEQKGWIVAVDTKTSRDLQRAYDKAMLNARTKIAQIVGVEVETVKESIDKELRVEDSFRFQSKFSRVITSMTKQSLKGSQVIAQSGPCREGNLWRAYVLVAYPERALWQGFIQEVSQDTTLAEHVKKTRQYKEIAWLLEHYSKMKD